MGMSNGSICLVPIINSIAGPGSFQKKLKVAFERRGIRVHHDPNEADTAAILIIAGTRHLPPLWGARRRGVRIVQRLNGINWVHRHRNLGLRYALRAELAPVFETRFNRTAAAKLLGVTFRSLRYRMERLGLND